MLLLKNTSTTKQAILTFGDVRYVIEPESSELIPDEFYDEALKVAKDHEHIEFEWEDDHAEDVTLESGETVEDALLRKPTHHGIGPVPPIPNPDIRPGDFFYLFPGPGAHGRQIIFSPTGIWVDAMGGPVII